VTTPNEIQAEREAITSRLAQLESAKRIADDALDAALVDAKTKRETHSRYLHTYQNAMVRIRQLTDDITAAELSVCSRILESEELSMKPFAEIDSKHIELERWRIFADLLASTFLRRADCDRQQAEAATVLAEAEQCDKLCDIREFQANLALVPLIEMEGTVVVDSESTATGVLRKRAANLRVHGNSMLKTLETY
jgi:hypothetical protein